MIHYKPNVSITSDCTVHMGTSTKKTETHLCMVPFTKVKKTIEGKHWKKPKHIGVINLFFYVYFLKLISLL